MEANDRAHAQGDRNFDGDLFDEDRHGSSSDWSDPEIHYATRLIRRPSGSSAAPQAADSMSQ
jgi:hypothetical protein